MTEDQQPLYRIIFAQNDQTYEVYSRYLTEESLMGFIEIEELVFDDVKSDVLLDPAVEKLRSEFKAVKRSYIPLHTILRIDEIVKEGVLRVAPADQSTDKKGNVSHLSLHSSKKPE